jgi:uncharacterized pyridoxal phosphate-dependent enzyme
MTMSFWKNLRRRELFTRGSMLAALGVLKPAGEAAAAETPAGNIYRSIGVRPVINARGTFTIITGSQTLPEVKRAMDEASRSYVHMDELMEGVSKRLAQITQAEWGIVTAGCAAGMTAVTAAAIAGTNPEHMQRVPDLTGLKNEVVIPTYSRNQYDHAIRMLGVKMIEVDDPSKLASAFNERTAMAYILAGPGDDGPLGTAAVAAAAKPHNVPVFVDAAAEILTIPNVHLKRGATVAAYSGGKCIRGPQCAGLLIGEKTLLQAAWLNSAPHHAFGRSLKVGKEEIMGMLAAVEAWTKRDHEAEFKRWEAILEHIATRVKKVDGIATNVVQPRGLSNRTPGLRIQWDTAKLGIAGTDVAKLLLDGEPRIVLAGGGPNGVSVTPYMMMPGDEKVVADRLYAVLSKPPQITKAAPAEGPPASIAGEWNLQIDFTRGSAKQQLKLDQQAGGLTGTHKTDFLSGDLRGTVAGKDVRFRSSHKIEGSRLSYDFTGTASGDTMTGTVDMGEYGKARWTATRRA